MTKNDVMEICSREQFSNLWDANDFISAKKVASGLDIDEHRYYSIATDVYEVDDGFVGVRGPYKSFTEMQTWDDIGEVCDAFPMQCKKVWTWERLD